MKKLLKRVFGFVRTIKAKFKALSFKKKALVVCAIIAVFIIGAVIIGRSGGPKVISSQAEFADITEVVSETGSIVASGRIDVYSPTNGSISTLYVENEDFVEEGRELFAVESSATEQEQQAAYANYLTAVAAQNSAKSNLNVLRSSMYEAWEDFRDLATNGTYEKGDGKPNEKNREAAEFQIAQDDWLAAEAKYKDQQKVVAQTEAQVSSTWLLYEATQNAVVKAPTSGTVSNLSVTQGSSVAVKSITTVVSPVLTIAKKTSTEVVVSLSETDITKIQNGQEATIDASAVDEKTYKGIVKRVDSIGTSIAGVNRYSVYVELVNPDNKLRSGMTVDTTVVTKKIKNVLSVPNSAVKPYQNGRAVRILDKSTRQIKYIPVEIGVRGKERTQILKGITEGEEVITSLSNEQLKRPGLFGS